MTRAPETPFATRLTKEGRKVFNTRTAPMLRLGAYLFMATMLPLYNHVYEGRWAIRETVIFGSVSMTYCFVSWRCLARWYGRTGTFDLQELFLLLDLALGSAFMLMTGAADTPMYPFLWFIVAANATSTHIRALRYVHLGIVSYFIVLWLSPWMGHPVSWGRAGISLAFLYFGGILLAMPTLLVDTLRKRNREAYSAIARLNEDLEAQAESLREARAAAERANKAKSTFLASMSHELRTPLNAILGFAQLLIRGRRLSPEDQENAGRILRSGEHLLGLINDVLSISKIEAGRLELHATGFNLGDLGRDLETMLRDRAQSKGLSLQVDLDPGAPEAVLGDEGKLRQILLNLLGNAIKFTGRGTVRLHIDYRDGWAGFAVQDTGPGMNSDELSRLFQPFYQAEAGVRASEGTGLGLHISKAMVEAMGGTLEVASAPGEGTTLQFRIPLPAGLAPAALEPRAETSGEFAPGQVLPRLLVVDDQEDNRALLEQLFSGLGLQVRVARDGVEAVELWERFRPGAVLMDIKMPRMDGLEAGRRIRAREAELATSPTILVALTASVFEEEREDLRDFDAFVAKPFQAEHLVATLAGLLGLDLAPAPQAAALEPGGGPVDLGALPGAWRAAFLGALRSGDLEEAEARIRELQDPKAAETLRAALRAYRFDELRQRLG